MLKPLALAVCLSAALSAQNVDTKFFKLDFVVKEVEGGKAVNSRAYATTISTEKGGNASIRAGSKIAYAVGTQFNFADVGVNLDARNAQESGSDLALFISADLSTVQPSETPNAPPIIRQNRWASHVLLALKKPTVIFSSDDLTTKRQMQLEVTATPIR